MPLSRRHFLSRVPVGVAATAVLIPTLSEAAAAAAANAVAVSEPILLNSNENPYGPFPSVQAAMEAALRKANRYPDHQYRELIGPHRLVQQRRARAGHPWHWVHRNPEDGGRRFHRSRPPSHPG